MATQSKQLPEWASSAFELMKPSAAAGCSEPDPDQLKEWARIRARFIGRWRDLSPDRWKLPADTDPRYDMVRAQREYPPSEYARQCILETAFECAVDFEDNRISKVSEALSKLQLLNEQIAENALALVGLFEERNQIKERFGLQDHDDLAIDPFRFRNAFELCFTDRQNPRTRAWCATAEPQTAAWLHIARTQSRPGPEWPDLLQVVADRKTEPARPGERGDAAAVRRTKGTRWSDSALQLIGRLQWDEYPPDFLVHSLTNSQLATLAEVAFDAPDSTYSEKQIAHLLARQKSYTPRNRGPIRHQKN